MSRKIAKKLEPNTAHVTPELLKANKATRTTRLCGDLDKYLYHLQSIDGFKHGALCAWCGEVAYTKCAICGTPLHNAPKKGEHAGKQCFLHYHNDMTFGQAYDDRHLKNQTRKDWRLPTRQEVSAHKKLIKQAKSDKKKRPAAKKNTVNSKYTLRRRQSQR